jgi:hypothetical protein
MRTLKFSLMKNAHYGFLLVTFISYVLIYGLIALLS